MNGEIFTVDLGCSHDISDIDLTLYDADFGTIASSASSSDDEQIILPILGDNYSGGVFFIGVLNFGDRENEYSLQISGPGTAADPISAVPLPAGLWLMLAAMGGFGLIAQRKYKLG